MIDFIKQTKKFKSAVKGSSSYYLKLDKNTLHVLYASEVGTIYKKIQVINNNSSDVYFEVDAKYLQEKIKNIKTINKININYNTLLINDFIDIELSEIKNINFLDDVLILLDKKCINLLDKQETKNYKTISKVASKDVALVLKYICIDFKNKNIVATDGNRLHTNNLTNILNLPDNNIKFDSDIINKANFKSFKVDYVEKNILLKTDLDIVFIVFDDDLIYPQYIQLIEAAKNNEIELLLDDVFISKLKQLPKKLWRNLIQLDFKNNLITCNLDKIKINYNFCFKNNIKPDYEKIALNIDYLLDILNIDKNIKMPKDNNFKPILIKNSLLMPMLII